MTSTTDTAGHPDVTEISDLTEGLLPPARSADVRRHLQTCELCADVHVSLEEIRGLLGSVSEAERMPADVAGRIDAALAAEALLSATAPEPQDIAFAGVTGSAPEEREVHVSRETHATPERPGGRPRATTGPGRKGAAPGRRRRRMVLGAFLTAAVLGAGTLALQSLGDRSSGTTTAQGEPTPSALPFSGASVETQVKDLLGGRQSRQGSDGRQPRSGHDPEQNTPDSPRGANTLIKAEVAVPGCVRAALHRSDDVLGAKTGTYDGKPAYLVVMPNAGDSSHVTAYIVGAACIQQEPDAVGKVLLKRSLTRS
ncbi:hypothetical protein GT045_38595 [Streptomyces sp. SID486]|uniref:hypothetical protein n=1 Tax=Streptomyces sp. SID486 TaxID=2690264 RepID=UPI00136972D5|nr:hypothetical protein [Streptomyces sp. SID486]